jgi:hypothetical protein
MILEAWPTARDPFVVLFRKNDDRVLESTDPLWAYRQDLGEELAKAVLRVSYSPVHESLVNLDYLAKS